MRKAEDFEVKSGNSSPEITYANMRNLKAQKPDNNPKAEAIKITQDRFMLVLIIFFILMFLILVIFISLAFVYHNKITEEVSHLMNGDMEKLRKEVNELKNEDNKITEEVSHLKNGDIEKLRNEVNELKNEVKECASQLEQHNNETKPSCERGWLEFEGHCYFVFDFKLNWTEAEKMCLNRESHLVIITSQAEQNFLLQHLNGASYWIGMTDIEKDKEFRWVDGTLLSSYTFWKVGEPNNWEKKEHCVHLFDEGKWNDVSCGEKLNAICEKRLV